MDTSKHKTLGRQGATPPFSPPLVASLFTKEQYLELQLITSAAMLSLCAKIIFKYYVITKDLIKLFA